MTNEGNKMDRNIFKEWKWSEDQFLRDWCGVYDLNELSARLERPRDRVRWRMEHVLGLKAINKTKVVDVKKEMKKVDGWGGQKLRGVVDLKKFQEYVRGGGMFSGD